MTGVAENIRLCGGVGEGRSCDYSGHRVALTDRPGAVGRGPTARAVRDNAPWQPRPGVQHHCQDPMNSGSGKNLVAGEFVAAASGNTIDVVNPASVREVIGRVPEMEQADLRVVFGAAEEGAKVWKTTGHLERGRVLINAGPLIRENAAVLTDVIVAEMGKTRAEAQGEVAKAAEFFEYFGALARLPFGELLPDARPDTFDMQTLEPLGIVLLITPWYDPLLTPARKLAPRLVAGNAVVSKPATETPIVTLMLAKILDLACPPKGLLATVTGRGRDIGEHLVGDPRVNAVSFTGSTSVGLGLRHPRTDRNGGKNAAVVLDDADLELAIPTIMAGAYGQAGQRCTATSRLTVQRGVADTVRELVANPVSRITIGAGDFPGVTMGPVVSLAAQAEVRARIEAALGEGATVISRSPLATEQEITGAYVEPVFLNVETSNSVWRDEVFGPVLAMIFVDTLEEAIDAVNYAAYRLSTVVFTRDLEGAFRLLEGVDTGQVSINQPTIGWDVHEPFGASRIRDRRTRSRGLKRFVSTRV